METSIVRREDASATTIAYRAIWSRSSRLPRIRRRLRLGSQWPSRIRRGLLLPAAHLHLHHALPRDAHARVHRVHAVAPRVSGRCSISSRSLPRSRTDRDGGGGFVVTALAAVDGIWHTRFGLDETLWSFPHAMLGAGSSSRSSASARAAGRSATRSPSASAARSSSASCSSRPPASAGPADRQQPQRRFIEFVASIPCSRLSRRSSTPRGLPRYDIHRGNPLFVPLASLSAAWPRARARVRPRPLVMLVLTAFATWTSTYVPSLRPGLSSRSAAHAHRVAGRG